MALKSFGLKFEHFIGKEQDLLEAARSGKVEVIEKLVSKSKSRQSTLGFSLLRSLNINCTDREGDTPLHLAALHGHRNAVEALLKAEALSNVPDNRGCTPLHLAAWNGHAEICVLLLGDVTSQVQINLQNGTGDTALHSAAQYGHATAVEVLLQHTADPTIRNLKEESPLDLAAQYGRVEVVQILLAKYPHLAEKTILNHSPLHLAASCGHKQVVEMLLNAGYQINTKTDQGTALHVAALYCKHDVVELLLEKGIDASDVNKDGLTAIQLVQDFAPDIAQLIKDHIESHNKRETSMKETEEKEKAHSPKPVPKPRKSLMKSSTGSLEEHEHSKEDLYSKPHKEKKEHDKEKVVEVTDSVFEDEGPPIPPRSDTLTRSHDEDIDMATCKEMRQSLLDMLDSPPSEEPPQTRSRPLSQPDADISTTPLLPSRPMTTQFDPHLSGGDNLHHRVPQPVCTSGGDNLNHAVPPPPCTTGADNLNQSFPPPACTINTKSQLVDVSSLSGSSTGSAYIPMDLFAGGVPKSSTQKEKPPKPARKKRSPVPQRKEITPSDTGKQKTSDEEVKTSAELLKEIRQEESNVPKEDYMRMSNVPPKPVCPGSDDEGPEDTYDVLFPSFKKGVNLEKGDHSQTDMKVVSENVPYTTYLVKTKPSDKENAEKAELTRIESGKFEIRGDDFESTDSRTSESKHSETHQRTSGYRNLENIPKTETDQVYQNMPKKQNIPELKTDQIYQNLMDDKHIPNIVRGDNSTCDKDICDNVDNSVSDDKDNNNVDSDVKQELVHGDKRISNGVCDYYDSMEQTHSKDMKEGQEEVAEDGKILKPDSLEFHKKRISKGEEFPLTPTGYVQPPTPDFPPPSPHTALIGIEEKFAAAETNKRTSRDMETITEDELLEAVRKSESSDNNPVTDIPDTLQRNGNIHSTVEESKLRSNKKEMSQESIDKSDEDVVVMRRSSKRSTSSSSGIEDVLSEEELGPFAGLLKGSAKGGTRKVVSQICENVAYRQSRATKRKSLPITSGLTFDPVMEREEDINPGNIMDAVEKITQSKDIRSSKHSDDQNFDYGEEWDKIENIMASFGSGIARESVFIRDFESVFAKQLGGAGDEGSNKIQSLGDWLDEIELGFYENTLVANGFDHMDFMNLLEEQDLEVIGVKTAEHRKKILDATHLLPGIQPIDPDNPPESVEQWLTSLHLSQYLDTFKSHKCDSMDRVLQLWELELNNVLHISTLGHKKRILMSLSHRKPPDRQFPSLKKRSKEPQETDGGSSKSSFKDINLFKDYTKVKPLTSSDEDVKESSQPAFPPVDSSEDEDVFRKDYQGQMIRDSSIHLRPPHHAQVDTPVKQWRHRPEMLIKGCCNYTAHYLGSTLVKELKGTDSTIEGISKLKKSADVIAKIPTIMLSMSYRGVKFIDAKSKRVICDHEIGNIFCACQDAQSMNFFAYITRDNISGKHYCHVFNVRSADMAREIILTLGEAFEVAYQMALKEKAAVEAMELERKLSHSDQEDTLSISSKASIHTV